MAAECLVGVPGIHNRNAPDAFVARGRRDGGGGEAAHFSFKNVVKSVGDIIDVEQRVLARVEVLGQVEAVGWVVAEVGVGVDFIHVHRPDGQRHARPLAVVHGVEVDVSLLAAHPAARDEGGDEAHEPSVGVAVGRAGLAAHVGLYAIAEADAAARALVDHGAEHINHLVGTLAAQRLVQYGLPRLRPLSGREPLGARAIRHR